MMNVGRMPLLGRAAAVQDDNDLNDGRTDEQERKDGVEAGVAAQEGGEGEH